MAINYFSGAVCSARQTRSIKLVLFIKHELIFLFLFQPQCEILYISPLAVVRKRSSQPASKKMIEVWRGQKLLRKLICTKE